MPRGIPNARESYRAPLRFIKRVEVIESGCWIWTGKPMSAGYGIFHFNGKEQTAHRAAYLMFIGPIAPNHDVHHKCRNRLCVSPDHLEAISKQEHGAHHGRQGGRPRIKT